MLSVQVLSWCVLVRSELIEVQSLVFCDIIEFGFQLYQFLPLYFVVVSSSFPLIMCNCHYGWPQKLSKVWGVFVCDDDVFGHKATRETQSLLCVVTDSTFQALVSGVYSVSVDLSAADVGENYKICWDCFLRYFLRLFLFLDAWNVFRRSKKEKINGWTSKFNPFRVRIKFLSLQTTVNIKAFKTGYQNYYFKNLKMFTYKMKDLGDVKVK